MRILAGLRGSFQARAELSLPSASASIGTMFIGKLALLLLALFAVALLVRLVLGVRRFRRRYDESAGDAAKRLRRRIDAPASLIGGNDKSRFP